MRKTNIVLDRDFNTHGVCGKSLAVVDETEYALGVVSRVDRGNVGEVYRRPVYAYAPASEQYGGWRWECDPHHVIAYASAYPAAVVDALRAIGY